MFAVGLVLLVVVEVVVVVGWGCERPSSLYITYRSKVNAMQCRCTTVERSVLSVVEVSRHANTLFAGVSGFRTPLGLSPNLPLPKVDQKVDLSQKRRRLPQTTHLPSQPASQR